MKGNDLLALLSLTSLILVSMHMADDYVTGFDKHVAGSPYPILIFVVWGGGLILLRERLVGRLILLLGGFAAVLMPIVHLNGHIPPTFTASPVAFRFVWMLYAVGTTGALTIILAVRELLGRRP